MAVLHLEYGDDFPSSVLGFAYAPNDGTLVSDVAIPSYPRLDRGWITISWLGQDDRSRYTSWISLFDGRVFATRSGPLTVTGNGFLSSCVGNYCSDFCRPVRFSWDWDSAVVYQQLTESYSQDPALDPRFVTILGSQRGPFARVKSDLGECAPVEGPIPEGQIDCLAPGTLVTLGGIDVSTNVPAARTVSGGGNGAPEEEYVQIDLGYGKVGFISTVLVDFRRTFEDLTLR